MNRLANKWVLITGATSGIGKASATLFAQNQANLIITGRRDDRLKTLKEELQLQHNTEVLTFCFDIRDREACKACVDSIQHPIDILLNNAGLAAGKGKIDDADFADWDAMIDTNIKGLLSMTRFVSERMKKQNNGHIINVGSIAGYEAYPGGSVYCATKYAVRAITQAAKIDLTGTNIRVSSVAPGLVETEFSKVRFHGDEEKAAAVYENIQPLTGMDIAEIILFMANRPPHVNILDTIVFPVAQSSATIVSRKSI
ncbi:SDR family NAD(P)-dependent oxidoreductase [Rhodohalobacter sp. 614A]|uniref:SDR family NAD(P)-dependent oxidoreductase n=1 Tax=Rhodohalobacter sp. 614A TaxID=2908649 RepID=UPI001F42473A|nr:SDR family NAD(P)-dependent oxidoreductase [Rhodohalobacter sp. 614A]